MLYSLLTCVGGMLRLLKSAGINGVVLLDVNACGDNVDSLRLDTLKNISTNLRPLFEQYAMTPFFSVCFGAPTEISNITSDPLNPKVQQWWNEKAKEIYALWPEFGGFLVKVRL